MRYEKDLTKLSDSRGEEMKRTKLIGPGVAALMTFLTLLQAEAKVVYTPVNITISGNGYLLLDLNHDGTNGAGRLGHRSLAKPGSISL